jgi:hypothetical protein
MKSEQNPGNCFQAASAGSDGSEIDGGNSCGGGADQQVVITGTATVAALQFVNDSTRCFTDSGSYATLEPCVGTDSQIWDLEITSGPSYTIYLFHSRSTGKCIGDAFATDTRLTMLDCIGSTRQQFSLS